MYVLALIEYLQKECYRRQHSRPPAAFTGTIPQQLGLSLSLICGVLILEIQNF